MLCKTNFVEFLPTKNVPNATRRKIVTFAPGVSRTQQPNCSWGMSHNYEPIMIGIFTIPSNPKQYSFS